MGQVGLFGDYCEQEGHGVFVRWQRQPTRRTGRRGTLKQIVVPVRDEATKQIKVPEPETTGEYLMVMAVGDTETPRTGPWCERSHTHTPDHHSGNHTYMLLAPPRPLVPLRSSIRPAPQPRISSQLTVPAPSRHSTAVHHERVQKAVHHERVQKEESCRQARTEHRGTELPMLASTRSLSPATRLRGGSVGFASPVRDAAAGGAESVDGTDPLRADHKTTTTPPVKASAPEPAAPGTATAVETSTPSPAVEAALAEAANAPVADVQAAAVALSVPAALGPAPSLTPGPVSAPASAVDVPAPAAAAAPEAAAGPATSTSTSARQHEAAGVIQSKFRTLRGSVLQSVRRFKQAILLVKDSLADGHSRSHLADGGSSADVGAADVLGLDLAKEMISLSLPPLVTADAHDVAIALLDRLHSLRRIVQSESDVHGQITLPQLERILVNASDAKRLTSRADHASNAAAFVKTVELAARVRDGKISWHKLQGALAAIALGVRRLDPSTGGDAAVLDFEATEAGKSAADAALQLLVRTRTRMLRGAVAARRVLRARELASHQELVGLARSSPTPMRAGAEVEDKSMRHVLSLLDGTHQGVAAHTERPEEKVHWPKAEELAPDHESPTSRRDDTKVYPGRGVRGGIRGGSVLKARSDWVEERMQADAGFVEVPRSIRSAPVALEKAMAANTYVIVDEPGSAPALIGGYDMNPGRVLRDVQRGLQRAETAVLEAREGARPQPASAHHEAAAPVPTPPGPVGWPEDETIRGAGGDGGPKDAQSWHLKFESLHRHKRDDLDDLPPAGAFGQTLYAHLSGVPAGTTQKAVSEYFASRVGHPDQLKGVKLYKDDDGSLRGDGVVSFHSTDCLHEVLEKNDFVFFGSKLHVSASQSLRVWDCAGGDPLRAPDRTEPDVAIAGRLKAQSFWRSARASVLGKPQRTGSDASRSGAATASAPAGLSVAAPALCRGSGASNTEASAQGSAEGGAGAASATASAGALKAVATSGDGTSAEGPAEGPASAMAAERGSPKVRERSTSQRAYWWSRGSRAARAEEEDESAQDRRSRRANRLRLRAALGFRNKGAAKHRRETMERESKPKPPTRIPHDQLESQLNYRMS